MGNSTILKVITEKDPRIIIDKKLNFQEDIDKEVDKANQKLGLINRSFKYFDTVMFLQLFKSRIRQYNPPRHV